VSNTPPTYRSTCCYCGVGCGVKVTDLGQGKVLVEGDETHPSNRGMLCAKGMNLHYMVMDRSDRLTHPQMRYGRTQPLQQVSWEAALDRTAAVFKTFIQKYGPDSVGFYVSGQCTTEEYYVINKLIKGFIGSNNIDTNSRLCMSSAVVGYKLSLGEDAVPVCYDDIELADTFFVTGANPAWCHPILWRRIEAHKAANPEVKIIVVDPRRTQTAAQADLHLQLNPGTDIVLYHAIGRILIERGWIDPDFIENHTDGFAAYQAQVNQRTLREAAQICGLRESDIKWAAEYIRRAKGYLSLWTMGLNQSVVGVNKNLALINLHLITGQIGRPGSGPFSLTGQPNAMGGREVGGLANLLPAHRDLANATHREEVAAFWGGGPLAEKPGFTATEMFEALERGDMKAIWIICTNPLVSLPNAAQVERALQKAKFVVVQDISDRSDTLAYADVVLPAANWLEKEGTMTNSERRITYLPKVLDAPGEALSDVDIILKTAEKMGFGAHFSYQNYGEIYQEHAQLTAGTNLHIEGLNYDILKEKRSVQWPYHSDQQKDTKRLFEDKQFFTPNKKAQIRAVSDENQSEPLDEDFPLILTTGRIRDQWHTMTKTGKVNKLNQHLPQPFLEIHPKDAQRLGIGPDAVVVVKSRRGQVQVKAKITTDIKVGVVFLPMHFGKIMNDAFGRANNLTNALYDPKSKEPDFKFTAVSVTLFQKPTEKIIIVGAGSAGLGFINTYRSLNQNDEIHVFSKEIYPFYNRIMLPDYVSGQMNWEQLVRMREAQFAENNIQVHKGLEIRHIDRKNKIVTDSLGQEHRYDRLILATGSRAFMPKGIPQLPGIFNMRSRLDADSLKAFLKPQGPHAVVIVGGGLLGTELAASLRHLDVPVTMVQRISRFMDRQLDPLGSQILHEEMVARGVEIFYNDEVAQIYGVEKLEGIRLKSGRRIDASALIYAIGTQPNIELAQAAGLEIHRGVVVNDYLQTSDPAIYALGEIAEWRGQLWGITAAAEQQAEVAARSLAGDLAAVYRGSLSMNILKMEGLHLASMGMVEAPAQDTSYEEVVFTDKARHYYKKCIVHNDRLVGAILIGDKVEFQEFKDLIANGIELSEKRLALLRSGQSAAPVLGRLVCSCHSVGEENLRLAVANGCTDFGQLCRQTGAGTGCGSCRPEVRDILEKTLKNQIIKAESSYSEASPAQS
jgi:ferredoxin-nitrate reductase